MPPIFAGAIAPFLILLRRVAASLNRIGISYNIGYAVAIALRYIPDVQDDFHKIKNAQEARGIEMSGKAKLMSRIKSTASIIFPLFLQVSAALIQSVMRNLYCLYKRVIKPAAIMIGNHKCNHGKSKHQCNTQIIIAL